MATWDVFHSDRLEVERGLTGAEVKAALARGDLREDDLIRPAGGAAPWTRIVDMPELDEGEPAPEPPPPPPPPPAPEPPPRREPPPPTPLIIEPKAGPRSSFELQKPANLPDDEDDAFEMPPAAGDDFEILDDDGMAPAEVYPTGPDPFGAAEHEVVEFAAPVDDYDDRPISEFDLNLRNRPAADPEAPSAEVLIWDDDLDDEYDPQEEDEAAAEFTLARGSAETVEELDLAAMVDVAFQLVLFFLVTATTVMYKSLEVPKPNPESAATASAKQGKSKSMDDLKSDFILVEVDPSGAVKIDREPVAADVSALAERLRTAREQTGRKAMLLSADFSTPHKSAVLAYDAANEIGLGIAIARPSPPEGR